MAIQFPCPSCHQPIEVDDEWASRPVACPYCHKTVTAPEMSTLSPEPEIPTAMPLSPPPPPLVGDAMEPVAVEQSNPYAPWALGLSSLALVLYISLNWFAASRIIEAVGPGATPEEIRQAMFEQMGSGPMPGWIVLTGFGLLFAVALWVGALIVTILALRRYPARRGLSLAAIATCGVTALLVCMGMFTSF